ncbi:anti-sigma B factor RsbW [Alkalihalobacillus sp. FSL W8-0930]
MNEHQVDHIEMSIPAKAEYVGVVRLTISGIANRLGFSYDDIEDMKIAVAEACTNAVSHAYEDGGNVKIACDLYEDRIEIIIADEGQSFDSKELQGKLGPVDSKQPIGDMKEGGLGLFLISTLMDKVQIHDEAGVVLMMTKFLRKNEVEEHVDGISSLQSEQG